MKRALHRARKLALIPTMVPALVIGACSATDVLNKVTYHSDFTVRTGISYGPESRHKLDVYAPKKSPHGSPVVLFFYGGSWNSGERSEYAFIGHSLSEKGITAVVADYRLYPEVRFPAFLDDCALAARWVSQHLTDLNAKNGKFYIAGHSAGAYNASMLALDTQRLTTVGVPQEQLAGWIGIAGPYDFLPIKIPEVQPVFHHPNYPPGTQPMDFITHKAPRTLLIAPPKDDLIDTQRSTVQLAKKLEAAGVPVQLRLYDSVTHITVIGAVAWPLSFKAPVMRDIEAFVKAE